jgi:hypothetical protein
MRKHRAVQLHLVVASLDLNARSGQGHTLTITGSAIERHSAAVIRL